MQKARGVKPTYKVVKDNDPTGYKSNKAKDVKRDLGIDAVPMPTYSPDFNPVDFSLWDAIKERMIHNAPEHVETVAAYKKRLRLTALRLPQARVTKAAHDIPKRMHAVVEAQGHNIPKDHK